MLGRELPLMHSLIITYLFWRTSYNVSVMYYTSIYRWNSPKMVRCLTDAGFRGAQSNLLFITYKIYLYTTWEIFIFDKHHILQNKRLNDCTIAILYSPSTFGIIYFSETCHKMKDPMLAPLKIEKAYYPSTFDTSYFQ